MQTVVLNADYTYLNTVGWKRGIKLLVLEKAETLKESERIVSNVDGTNRLKVPLVLKLVRLVQTVYRNKVPFSRKNVFIRDNRRCQYCGTSENLSIDHVIPSSRGGKSSFLNCVVCCVNCNLHKGNKTLREAGMKLHRLPHEPTIIEFLTYKMKHTGAYQFLKDLGIY